MSIPFLRQRRFLSPTHRATESCGTFSFASSGKNCFLILFLTTVYYCICRLLLTGDFLGNMVLWTVSPFKEKHKPVCRWDYLVQDDFDHTKWKRSTPTTVAFHPAAHTLFIGGTSGEFG
jgi:hypothetical protein